MTMNIKRLATLLLAATTVMLASAAGAHPGHIEHELGLNTFASGLAHPLTGIDHLLAMLAVGLWSALAHHTVRQAILTPMSFLALLFVGATLGLGGFHLPAVEPMIIASLFVLGLLVATPRQLPRWAGPAIVGFFALFHGLAHGSELPSSGSAMAFVAGFMLSTFGLHAAGLLAGLQLKRRGGGWASRVLGTGIAMYGAGLLVAM